MTPLRHTLAPGALAGAFGLVLALSLARAHGVELGLPLDDAWIHAAFARHFARSGEWGLFAGQRSGGETSLLWPLLLSTVEKFTGGGAPRMALLLGGACWLVLPAVAGTFASTQRRSELLALAVGVCGPLLFLSLSGMETVPVLLLGLTAIARMEHGDARTAALAVALATALRPDAILLLVVLAFAAGARRDAPRAGDDRTAGRRVLLIARDIAPGAALSVIALGLLALAEGRFPPSTLVGRRWIEGFPASLQWSAAPHGLLHLLRSWAHALSSDLGWARVASEHPFPLAQLLRWSWFVVSAAAVAAGAWVVARGPREEEAAESAPPRALRGLLLWAALSLAAYAIVLPSRGHLGRYQAPLYLAFLALVVEGVAWGALRPWHGVARRVLGTVCSVLLASGFIAGWINAARLWGNAVSTVNVVHVRAALELPAHLPRNARLAVFDVGAVSYFHGGSMIDLSGLSDPQIASALFSGDLTSILRERGATHLLMPQMGAQNEHSLAARLGLLPHDGFQLEPIVGYTAGAQLWGEAFNYSGNVFPKLQLSRIVWSTEGTSPTTAPADLSAPGSR